MDLSIKDLAEAPPSAPDLHRAFADYSVRRELCADMGRKLAGLRDSLLVNALHNLTRETWVGLSDVIGRCAKEVYADATIYLVDGRPFAIERKTTYANGEEPATEWLGPMTTFTATLNIVGVDQNGNEYELADVGQPRQPFRSLPCKVVDLMDEVP